MWSDAQYTNDEDRIRAILRDYTGDNSTVKRLLTMRWNRHHVTKIELIHDGSGTSKVQSIYTKLKKIPLIGADGYIRTLIMFIEQKHPEVRSDFAEIAGQPAHPPEC
ncbi:MAG: DUF5617 domain-containing protein [Gammaproteobacteria bacterium]